jgi:hypothetical protein
MLRPFTHRPTLQATTPLWYALSPLGEFGSGISVVQALCIWVNRVKLFLNDAGHIY